MTPTIPQELRRAYSEGKLLPFVGAGASRSVSWDEEGERRQGPSWAEMVDQAAWLVDFDDAELLRARGTDQQILEYFKLRQNGYTQNLMNWLHRMMQPPDSALLASVIHSELAAMEACRLVYTTNYDDFLERSMVLHGREYQRVALEADMGSSRAADLCEIVKFHGDWDHPDRTVLTESDYERRMQLEAPMDYRLRADLLGRTVLFIGYSFRDANVAYIFRLMAETAPSPGSTRHRAFIFFPEPSDFEMRLFEERGIGVLPTSLDGRAEDVAAALENIRS